MKPRPPKKHWFNERVNAAWNWLDMVKREAEDECMSEPKFEYLSHCHECPFFFDIDNGEYRGCVSQIADDGMNRLARFMPHKGENR